MTFKVYLDVLKNFDFAKLWVSQITSQLTNYILSFAILIRIFELTDSSAKVALAIMAFGFGTVFFGSLAGVYADRFDKRWLLTVINFLQAGSIALYFVLGGSFWALLTITFIYSSLNQFYIPAEAPSIPLLVKKEQILVANSYFVFTNSAALIIGFASAGLLIETFGLSTPFLVGTILLLIAALATFTLPSLPPMRKYSNPYSFSKVWHEFKEGISYFWQNDKLHFPLVSLVAIQIVNGMLITVAPAFMSDVIALNPNTGSLLLIGPFGVGILIGALLLGMEGKKLTKPQLVILGFLGMGVFIASLALVRHMPNKYLYYAAAVLIIGYFNAHIFAPSHSIIQTEAVSHIRGRIYGSLYVLLQTVATFPTIIIGVLADKVALTTVMGGLGTLLFVFGLFIRNYAQTKKLT